MTALLAGAPKVAAVALLTRFTVQGFGPLTHDWQQVIVFLSIASMLFGAFAAIGQRNIKRLMAYSSIGHMGYVLVGLAAGTEAGEAARVHPQRSLREPIVELPGEPQQLPALERRVGHQDRDAAAAIGDVATAVGEGRAGQGGALDGGIGSVRQRSSGRDRQEGGIRGRAGGGRR